VTIVFLTTVLPGGRRTGGEVASQTFIDALRDIGARVLVLGYQRPGEAPPGHPDDLPAAVRHIETSAAGARALPWLARALARRLPYSASKYVSRAYRRRAGRVIAAERPDLVIVDHAQSGWVAPRGSGRAPYALLAHNAEHRLYDQQARDAGPRKRPLLRREAKRMRALEAVLARDAAAVWALTPADAEALGRLSPTPCTCIEMPPRSMPPAALPTPEADVALLGQWTWAPNAAGLRWFLDEVCPRLPAGLSVRVGGDGSLDFGAGHPEVELLGRVAEPMDFLRSARVVAVPSVAGGGVQVKTLDGIASGRPVVATGVATREIDPLPGSLRRRDDPAAFASALVEAREDPADAVLAQAREWAELRARMFRGQLASALEAAT
jgi:glycosyltransferase involved in cell wall biosynthesis